MKKYKKNYFFCYIYKKREMFYPKSSLKNLIDYGYYRKTREELFYIFSQDFCFWNGMRKSLKILLEFNRYFLINIYI